MQESARKVLKNRFTGANESYIDMSGYSRESRGNLIKEYYKKKPKIMEYIIYKMFSQTRKEEGEIKVIKLETSILIFHALFHVVLIFKFIFKSNITNYFVLFF